MFTTVTSSSSSLGFHRARADEDDVDTGRIFVCDAMRGLLRCEALSSSILEYAVREERYVLHAAATTMRRHTKTSSTMPSGLCTKSVLDEEEGGSLVSSSVA
jgi:hypothetical protein